MEMSKEEALRALREYVYNYHTAPTLADMPRRSLEDKGIRGPTSAHRIEEIHTPLNLEYVTATTGTTAFQNIVGVTSFEIPDRIHAAHKALRLCGIASGDHLLVTYPPLVNVFPRAALDSFGVSWSFLKASSRDAVLLELCEKAPKAILGESSFIRAVLESAKQFQLDRFIPSGLTIMAAGTPLDMQLLPLAERFGANVHDLYGCQEFGWLTLDGIPLRTDIALLETDEEGLFDMVIGGLPTGDRFPVLGQGHLCNVKGKIITYGRKRSWPELEATVLQTTASSVETVERLARTILRIKAKIVRIARDCEAGKGKNVLSVGAYPNGQGRLLSGSTRLFDTLLDAQLHYQSMAKNDPAWSKER